MGGWVELGSVKARWEMPCSTTSPATLITFASQSSIGR